MQQTKLHAKSLYKHTKAAAFALSLGVALLLATPSLASAAQGYQVSVYPKQLAGALLSCARGRAAQGSLRHVPTATLRADLRHYEGLLDKFYRRYPTNNRPSLAPPILLAVASGALGVGGMIMTIAAFQVTNAGLQIGLIVAGLLGAIISSVVLGLALKWYRARRRKHPHKYDLASQNSNLRIRAAILHELKRRGAPRSQLPTVHGRSLALAF